MASVASHNRQQAVRNLLRSDSEDLGERKDAPDDDAVYIAGTDDSPGKLQVTKRGAGQRQDGCKRGVIRIESTLGTSPGTPAGHFSIG